LSPSAHTFLFFCSKYFTDWLKRRRNDITKKHDFCDGTQRPICPPDLLKAARAWSEAEMRNGRLRDYLLMKLPATQAPTKQTKSKKRPAENDSSIASTPKRNLLEIEIPNVSGDFPDVFSN
jgi:hypothetical protein